MQTIRWYFDFISPFAYLQLHRLRSAGVLDRIEARPILFAAVLDAIGNRGPAEIDHKRLFTYRFVQWQAGQMGLPLRFPPAHPFNPLTALRLCHALGSGWDVVAAIFEYIWAQGGDPTDAQALDALARRHGADNASVANAPEVKLALRSATDEALARGVFGVPTLAVGDQLFWGQDATGLALAVADDPQLLETGEMARFATLPIGVTRS